MIISLILRNRIDLQLTLVQILCNSGYIVQKIASSTTNPIDIIVEKSGESVTLHVYLKNITPGGWADKPHIYRVQVKNCFSTQNIPKITPKEITLICGICIIDNEPILCAWNVYCYVLHKTNRSCYVFSTSLFRALERGYYSSRDFGQNVWVCRSGFVEALLHEYVKMTCIEDIV